MTPRAGFTSLPYREVWIIDFEFRAPAGERPEPVCLVGLELLSGRCLELWADELRACPRPPFEIGADTLIVSFYASAELGCFRALNWPMPARILDLFAEFRVTVNGRPAGPGGSSLIGAALWYGLDAMAADTKADMRALVLRGPPYTDEERRQVLAYCREDVDLTAALFWRMLPELLARGPTATKALGQSLLRGRFMAAASAMEWVGIPVDAAMLGRIREAWPGIKGELVTTVDRNYGVYEGLSFRVKRFEAYLAAHGIITSWPRLESGALALDDLTFRDQARAFPQLDQLRQLRRTLGELRLEALSIGQDGRNRCLLSAFRSRTGRNQPSNTRFAFGPAAWVRCLIRPEPGRALAYVDFTSQEMGIAAALSGDQALLDAYQSGDLYLNFAKRAGLAPADATKETHGEVRERCKTVVLGTLYGMGAETLARRIGRPVCEARELLHLHRATYPRFWRWSDETVAGAILSGRIQTVFGWALHVGAEFNETVRKGGRSHRTLMNFPMQANGSEAMRLTACFATERGISVCAPIHDAFLIEAPDERILEDVAHLQHLMAEASSTVLGGRLALRSEAKVVRFPGRYADPRGTAMWTTIMGLLDRVERAAAA